MDQLQWLRNPVFKYICYVVVYVKNVSPSVNLINTIDMLCFTS